MCQTVMQPQAEEQFVTHDYTEVHVQVLPPNWKLSTAGKVGEPQIWQIGQNGFDL